MKKKLVAVVAVVVLVAGSLASAAAAQGWPPVKPIVAVTSDGTRATVVVMIQNDVALPDRLRIVDIRVPLLGNRLLSSWAGDPNSNPAKNYGDHVGWVSLGGVDDSIAMPGQEPAIYPLPLDPEERLRRFGRLVGPYVIVLELTAGRDIAFLFGFYASLWFQTYGGVTGTAVGF